MLAFKGEFLGVTMLFFETLRAVQCSDTDETDGETDCALPTDCLCFDCFIPSEPE